MRHRGALLFVEQVTGFFAAGHHAFGHPVVQQRRNGLDVLRGQRFGAAHQGPDDPGLDRQTEFGDALDAPDRQATVVRDVGGFRCPGRDRAQARRDHDEVALHWPGVERPIGQQGCQPFLLRGGQRLLQRHPVHEAGVNAADPRVDGLQLGQQGLGLVGSQGVAALEVHQGGHRGGGAFGHGEGPKAGLRREKRAFYRGQRTKPASCSRRHLPVDAEPRTYYG